MRLLDLFCGAGGAAVGYHRAGFDEIVGVDIAPQPHYPFEFVQADALAFPLDGFDVIHASPPCQAFTRLNATWNAREHPNLIPATRQRLIDAGVAYVIENVPGAPLCDPLLLCGSMFRLGTGDAELRRHRLFEICPGVLLRPPCNHGWAGEVVGVYGHSGGTSTRARVIGVYGGHGHDRRREVNFSTDECREAMGIDWMTGAELSQAIPPAYTEWIGRQLIRVLTREGPSR